MLDKPLLPHHKLLAFGVARELLVAVRAADIRDTHLRDQAMRAAQSACLNCCVHSGSLSRVRCGGSYCWSLHSIALRRAARDWIASA